jgi:hypothetical protein
MVIPLQRSACCYFHPDQQHLVQLTSLAIAVETGDAVGAELNNGLRTRTAATVEAAAAVEAVEAVDSTRHLIGLSSTEALMLFQLLQAALLHPPMREGVMGQPQLHRFHRQLSGALGRALASGAQK